MGLLVRSAWGRWVAGLFETSGWGGRSPHGGPRQLVPSPIQVELATRRAGRIVTRATQLIPSPQGLHLLTAPLWSVARPYRLIEGWRLITKTEGKNRALPFHGRSSTQWLSGEEWMSHPKPRP